MIKLFSKHTLMISVFIFTYFFLSAANYASGETATPFEAWTERYDEPAVMKKITPLEKKLLGKIGFSNGTPSYNGKLIELYLCASGITDDAINAQYCAAFEKSVNEANNLLSKKENRALNEYNRAEFLLHFLHATLFRTTITGSGAGYNIGIRETLDTGAYNCYKSALIYNAFLEYFGYRTSMVLVPNHIYSIVYIDGIAVDVETTNRYGFDPYRKGGSRFARAFDAPNVIFDKTTYRNARPAGNIDVLSQVYSNRMLLFSGARAYSGEKVPRDLERGASLGIIGMFLNQRDDAVASNCLTTFQTILQEATDKNPASLETEADRYLKTAALFRSCSEYPNSVRNFAITVLTATAQMRKTGLMQIQPGENYVHVFTDSFPYYEKYLRDNAQFYAEGYYNTTVECIRFITKHNPSPDSDAIAGISRTMQQYFSNTHISTHPRSAAYRQLGSSAIAGMINNAGAAAYNLRDFDKAEKIFSEGIAAAKAAQMYDAKSFSTVERNLSQLQLYIRRSQQNQ